MKCVILFVYCYVLVNIIEINTKSFLGVIKIQYMHYSDSSFELDVQSSFVTAKTRFDRQKLTYKFKYIIIIY